MKPEWSSDPTRGIDWRAYLKSIPNFVPSFALSLDGTALLVVDMQRSCADRTAGQGEWLQQSYPRIARYYYDRVETVVTPRIRRLLNFFRERGRKVVFLTVGPHLPDWSDFNPLRRTRESELIRSHDVTGVLSHSASSEHVVIPELAPLPGELVLNKVSRSAFNSTGLDQLLRNMGVDGLVVTGVVTNGCVWATAGDAADRGYKCILLEDACAAFTQTLHDTALLQFAHGYGDVLDTDSIVRMLDAK